MVSKSSSKVPCLFLSETSPSAPLITHSFHSGVCGRYFLLHIFVNDGQLADTSKLQRANTQTVKVKCAGILEAKFVFLLFLWVFRKRSCEKNPS